ncbi:MAG: bifunctional folylpolyglutamate synthase/dihydrofolate synthase, partial [Deltaproteobacteria bacterium]|nr:bifunctional folylpolyglutamate synthase/dihydrofolate synthase [Deltaproteobacteria bacterium]
MYGLRRFGIKLGLETIGKILETLGNPHKSFKCIHVAGTNGKGSIASALASILHASGYKTGLYTSPHLVRFNERICINNEPVSDEDVINSYEKVKKVQEKADRGLTFFEYTTAMAFYEFGRQKVDWAVIETGMGGRLDATNIIEPSISIISNLSIEHTTYLGNTIAQIAEEKGGIIKENTPVVT